MNITSPVVKLNGRVIVEPTAVDDLDRSGTAFPDITGIIFNTCSQKTRAVRNPDKTLKIDPATGKPVREVVADYPILATTLYFADGSKVTVENSKNDPVTDANGEVTKEAYERGIIYAIAKRLFGEYAKKDGKLVLKTEGFGRILSEMVANAYNTKEEAKKREAAKEAAHKAHLEREAAAKANPKPKRQSLAATVAQLAATVTELKTAVAELRAAKEA